jgi:hypothetical protein
MFEVPDKVVGKISFFVFLSFFVLWLKHHGRHGDDRREKL